MPMMTLDYVCTFEFEMDPPRTHKGKVQASSVQACARIAVTETKNTFPNSQWSSVVVVLTREGLLDAKAGPKESD